MDLAEYVTKVMFWAVLIGAGGYGIRIGVAQVEETARRTKSRRRI